jgi:hypothetical protein
LDISAGLPSGSGKPNPEIEASEERRQRNKEFFMRRILILVIGLNQFKEEMILKSMKFIRFSENIFRVYTTIF